MYTIPNYFYKLIVYLMNVIDFIKNKMRSTGFTSEKISEITGISKYSIDNVLQGKSRKYDYIVAITEALNIPLFDSIIESQDKDILIEGNFYSLSLKIISNILDKRGNLHFSKFNIQNYTFRLYKYIIDKPNNTDLHIAFAEGLLSNIEKK